jgi:hypothetical protein
MKSTTEPRGMLPRRPPSQHIGATSRPQVQQASVGRRRPAASSQVGGVIQGLVEAIR